MRAGSNWRDASGATAGKDPARRAVAREVPIPVPIDPATERYERAFPVEAGDIDQLGHVSSTVYLRWVQDMAIAHWSAAATAEQQAGLIWVVVRHEIDYV